MPSSAKYSPSSPERFDRYPWQHSTFPIAEKVQGAFFTVKKTPKKDQELLPPKNSKYKKKKYGRSKICEGRKSLGILTFFFLFFSWWEQFGYF